MKVIHILEDFSLQSGGIRTVVNDLHTRLLKANINSLIITPKSEENDDVIRISGENKAWSYSNNLEKTLAEQSKNSNTTIIHIHGVWMHPQYFAAKFAHKNNIPFIVSCHGMYEPWLWTKGTLKKKIYFKLLAKPAFSKANYIHAITRNEALEIKKLLPSTDTVEIPNLIDFEDQNSQKYNSCSKYILYLGRLDEKKGIDILIKAFKNINSSTFKLKIAGEINEYKNELDKLVIEFNLQDRVEFLGIVTGKNKTTLFQNAFVFAAPSHSEVIGMVNLEAAILNTPVITTHQTGIDSEWQNNGGYLINPNEEELTKALEKATSLSLEERNNRGEKLKNFVLKNYSWKNRFFDWVKLYESIL
jgi:glycosyltransferase involved in cell wall biosynthesis